MARHLEDDALNCMLEHAARHFTYKEIGALLQRSHGVNLSPNAIRKRLKRAGAPSRRGPTMHSVSDVRRAVQRLLSELPQTVGYRQMTDHLRQNNMHVRRDTVMQIMRQLDATGVEMRRRRRIERRIYSTYGPNHIWHVDGYDKLKPYGFPIHGCIDGYSRKILWLSVGPSNNDPAAVAYNFVETVDEVKGCPMVLQTDPGTENCVMGALQCVFRHNSKDCFSGIHSYHITKSVFNQRIEAWWSMMRRQQSEWWICFFKELEAFGGFHRGNENDLHCIRYCFMPVLQYQLDSLMERWNDHYISRSRGAVCPNGRPTVLYSLAEVKGFADCLQQVSQDDTNFANSQCKAQCRSGSVAFDIRAHGTFQRMGWNDTHNWKEALQHYCRYESVKLL